MSDTCAGRTPGTAHPSSTRASLALLALFLSACGDSGTSRTGLDYAVLDSAGVRIVEYAGTPTPTHSITVSEPLFRHGHREGDYLFTLPWSGALQPDGSVVVSDAVNAEIVVIGPDGAVRSILATRGQGPGEVRPGAELVLQGQDTVLVHDTGNRRITVFENGVVSRNVPLIGASPVRVAGVDSSGRVLLRESAYTPGFAERWLQGPLIRLDLASDTYDTLGAFDWIASPHEVGENNPYAPEGQVTVSGGAFIHGRSDRPELIWRDQEGRVRQITRWQPRPRYPTEADWDAMVSALRQEYSVYGFDEAMFARSLEPLEVDPERPLPLFMSLHGDGEGRLWLEEFVSNRSPGLASVPSYELIDSDGLWLGRLVSPPRFRMLDVSGDLVLGAVRDELDVESIAVYRLEIMPRHR